MASVVFYAGEDFAINALNGSGLGFFGGGFGQSIDVGSYNDATFITDSNGSTQGPQVDNIKWLNSASGIVNGASSGIALTAIPNYLATLRINFNHSSNVRTQNVKLRAYDRVSINNDPSGVTFKVAELIHPDTVQNNTGSGSTTWQEPTGSSVIMSLTASPGESGLRPNGASTSDKQHDWYLALSGSPDSIGSKNFALYIEMEYL